ncbi:MAG: nucleotide disphospho-sugar-binding domain-containing protein [Dermatophilaceae bacterium]
MSTFLFVTIPIPAHTTNPMPLAARLVEGGHSVVWLAGQAFHERLASTGAIPLPYRDTPDFSGRDIAETFPQLVGLDGVRGIRRAFADIFVGLAAERVADIQRVLRHHPIDAMLTDGISYGPGLVHELGGPPWASFGDGPLPFEDADAPPFGPGLLPMPGPLGRARNAAVRVVGKRVVFGPAQHRWDQIRRDLGLPTGPGVLASAPSPLLHLQGCMPSFDYPMAEPPPQVHWVGPLRPDPSPWHQPPWWVEVLRSPRPMILVSQGSIRSDVTELTTPTIRALADLPVNVVVTTGQASPADVLAASGGTLPPNTHVTDFIPYDTALAHASCFVTNGGYTGVTLALAHGVPIVQAGTTEEKAEIGARIHYTGVGIRLGTSRPTPQVVRAAVRSVLDDSRYAIAAGRMQAECSHLDAGSRGADLLVELARTRRLVPVRG